MIERVVEHPAEDLPRSVRVPLDAGGGGERRRDGLRQPDVELTRHDGPDLGGGIVHGEAHEMPARLRVRRRECAAGSRGAGASVQAATMRTAVACARTTSPPAAARSIRSLDSSSDMVMARCSPRYSR